MQEQLEQDSLFDQLVHFELPITDPQNDAARDTVLSVYLCPTDRHNDKWELEDEDTGTRLGREVLDQY